MTAGGKSSTDPQPPRHTPKTRALTYLLLLLQLSTQFIGFTYLYLYVQAVERDLRVLCGEERAPTIASNTLSPVASTRRKRSGDNAVSRQVYNVAESTAELTKETKKGGSLPEPVTTPDDKEWVWLNSDTRIQFEAIENFCLATSKYCPQGMPGSPGLPGAKGEMGVKGAPGGQGPPGPKGPAGPAGLDGRDGVPGEPGLDGVPGRNGRDGVPGINGKPGLNGSPGQPGRNGRNGTNGIPGERGPQGPPGPRGETGAPGIPGKPGEDGKPGISAWNFVSRDPTVDELLIPPSILLDNSPSPSPSSGGRPATPAATSLISVIEGTNVRLKCAASGKPKPLVQWARTDGTPIPIGSWHVSAVTSETLNISCVGRRHMGEYSCTADNGLPPAAIRKFYLQVKFPPLIRIHDETVYLDNPNAGTLECEVEAYPKPTQVYWERENGRRFAKQQSDGWHKTEIFNERDGHKFKMRLKIMKRHAGDLGHYFCVVSNDLGTTKGVFLLHDNKTWMEAGRRTNERKYITFGRSSVESCADLGCSTSDCPFTEERKDATAVRPLGNATFASLPTRVVEGVIIAMGKPVLKGPVDGHYASWMYDVSPRTNTPTDQIWFTRRSNASYIFAYNASDHGIRLSHPFQGNGHIVYNGSFYYNPANRTAVLRRDLYSDNTECTRNDTKCELNLPGLSLGTDSFLFTPNHNYNYIDFNVDENGFWLIYGLPSNNTAVMKIDPLTMSPQYAWNISINHHNYGEMFIASGVLYAVDGLASDKILIRFAFDLYKNATIEVNLSSTNPSTKTTTVSYNYKTKDVYILSRGNPFAYPVMYNISKEPDA